MGMSALSPEHVEKAARYHRSGRSAPLLFAVSLAAIGCTRQSGPAADERPVDKSSQEQASRPRPADSGKIEAALVLDRARILLGEPTHFSFVVMNRTTADRWMLSGGDYRNALGRPESYRCTAENAADGTPVASPDAGPTMGGIATMVAIPAGGSAKKRLFLPNWARFSAPGSYRITCATTLALADSGEFAARDDDYDKLDVRASAPLQVLPADRDALGKLIEKFGRAMLDRRTEGADEAGQKLAAITDPRVIPFYAEAIADPALGLEVPALRVLGRFDDDAALAAIRLAMKKTGKDVENATTAEVAAQVAANIRYSAALALAESPHREARGLLLTMQNDPSSAVRLAIVHKLAKEDTAEATALLEKFAGDREALVAGEARRYLDLRKRGGD